jgi:3-keto-disaccharide hydrolase
MIRWSPVAVALTLAAVAASTAVAQQPTSQVKPMAKPEDTEVWKPVPKIVTPGPTSADPASDAVVLFDGRNQDEWVSARDGSPAKWTVGNGVLTVVKAAGDIQTKRSFTNYQLHVEWRIPENVTGKDQARGNSGVYLAWTNDFGYELQVLDSYQNETYVNGQAGSIYKQFPPLVNAMRKPGEWQTYDVVWTAPTFKSDGSLATPAYVTAVHNGVLIQNHVALTGDTKYIGTP